MPHKFDVGDRVVHVAPYTYHGGRKAQDPMTHPGSIDSIIGTRADPEYIVKWDEGPRRYVDENSLAPLEEGPDKTDEAYVMQSLGVTGRPGYSVEEQAAYKAGWDDAMAKAVELLTKEAS